MSLDSILPRQGRDCGPAWRVLDEVRVVEPIRIPPPPTGEKGQTPGIENRPEAFQEQPAQAPHLRRGKKKPDEPPDQDTKGRPFKGRTGERQGSAATTQLIDTDP